MPVKSPIKITNYSIVTSKTNFDDELGSSEIVLYCVYTLISFIVNLVVVIVGKISKTIHFT